MPAPPSSTLAPALPVSLSAYAEPVRFSIDVSVSRPEPPVVWALVMARLTVTPVVPTSP